MSDTHYSITSALREIGVPVASTLRMLNNHEYPEDIVSYTGVKITVPEKNMQKFKSFVLDLRKKESCERKTDRNKGYRLEVFRMLGDIIARLEKIEARLEDISAKIHG